MNPISHEVTMVSKLAMAVMALIDNAIQSLKTLELSVLKPFGNDKLTIKHPSGGTLQWRNDGKVYYNGDEINDVFLPVITNAENIEGLIEEFRVYSRWGTEVYVEFGPDVKGWDGDFQGELAPPEVYLYFIKLRLPNGEEQIRKGDVTLIR